MRCPHCGQEHLASTVFCPKTGLKLISYVCTNCGAEIQQSWKVCPKCGKPVSKAERVSSSRSKQDSKSSLSKKPIRIWVLFFFAVIVLAFAIYLMFPGLGILAGMSPARVSRQITASEGGELALRDDTSLAIPPNSLQRDTQVSMRKTRPENAPVLPEELTSVGSAYLIDLGTEQLKQPATLEIPFDPGLLPNDVEPSQVFLSYYDESKKEWVFAGGKVDTSRNVIILETAHASWWMPTTWNWNAWIAILSKTLEGNIASILEAAALLAQECPQSGDYVNVNSGQALNMMQGCIDSDDTIRPNLRIVNIKSFYYDIRPITGGNSYPSATVLAPGEDITFTASTSDPSPLVIEAEFTQKSGLYLIFHMLITMLPGANQIGIQGATIACFTERLSDMSYFVEAAAALAEHSDLSGLAAAQSLRNFMKNENAVRRFTTAADDCKYGPATTWSWEGIKQISGAFNVILGATDYVANFLAINFRGGNLPRLSFQWTQDTTPIGPAGEGDFGQITFLRDGNIWTIRLDGSNQEQITNSGQINYFRWSPDGKRIFYSRIDIIDRLYVYDLASRQENSITIPRPSVDSPPNFDVSPDGKTLLLLMADEDTGLTYSLLSLDLGTRDIKKITTLDGAFVRVRFLNASDEVVLVECAQSCGISTLNLESLQSEEFTDLIFGWAFDVLPDKRAIAVEHSLGFLGLVPCGNDPACQVPSGIYEFDLDTRKYSPLVLDEEQVVTEPDISADNDYLVFEHGNNIEIKNLRTGELKSLVLGSLPSWRPSAQSSTLPPESSSTSLSEGWIAFLNKNNLWIGHPDGSELKSITSNPISDSQGPPILDYKWSPDGKMLAYSISSNIYLYDTQTSEITTLQTSGAGGFDWSLNGKQLIYDTSFSEGSPWSNDGIWVIGIENGRTRQVIPSSKDIPGLRSPEWSSEGSHVLFYIPSVFVPSYEPPGYGVADFTTGKSIRLPVTLVEGQTSGSCRWAPNDLIIACASAGDENAQSPDLSLIDVSGNIIRKITLPEKMRFPMVRWSQDGNKLAIGYYDQEKALTDILTLDTEAMETLASGLPSDWSPDGQWLLTSGDTSNDPPVMTIVNTTSGQSAVLSEGRGGVWQP